MKLRSLKLLVLSLLVAGLTHPVPAQPVPPPLSPRPVAVSDRLKRADRAEDIRVKAGEARFYAALASKPVVVEPPKPASQPRVRQEGMTGAQEPQQAAYEAGVWDRIAQCESHGDWHINTGNSYFGGLQMNMQFWHSYGGDEFAERPDLASREQQIVVAERARDSGRGYGPWPTCGKRA